MNNFKTGILMAFLMGLFALIGYFIGGITWMIILLIVAMGMNVLNYWYCDRIVVAATKAKAVDEKTAPRMARIVHKLCDNAKMPYPKLYILPQPMPNAFATGRDPEHAVVACTEGLLSMMDDDELEGVLAHELAHVKNRDILISTIVATVAGAIMLISIVARFMLIFGGGNRRDNPLGIIGLLALVIVTPIAAMLIQMAISRSREYEADQGGGEISGNPMGLARALAKLDGIHKANPRTYASRGAAHMYIYSPLNAREAFVGLFSTHPPISKRIEKLMEQAMVEE